MAQSVQGRGGGAEGGRGRRGRGGGGTVGDSELNSEALKDTAEEKLHPSPWDELYLHQVKKRA